MAKGIDFLIGILFRRKPNKRVRCSCSKEKFDLEVVDILLKALENTLKRPILVADVRPEGTVETKFPSSFQYHIDFFCS